MKRYIIIAVMFVQFMTATCTTLDNPWDYSKDIYGYYMPPECMKDLSQDARVVNVPVILGKTQEELHAIYNHNAEAQPINSYTKIWGLTYYIPGPGGYSLILVAKDVPEYQIKYVVHHEWCHVIAGQWHDRGR